MAHRLLRAINDFRQATRRYLPLLLFAYLMSACGVAEDLQCLSLNLSSSEVTLPALDVHVWVEVRNSSSHPIILVKPDLSFQLENSDGRRFDVSRSVYVEPEASNPWFVQPGRRATLKFLVQLLHDAPVGRVRVQPRIEWISQGENVIPWLTLPDEKGAATAGEWSVHNPAAPLNATAAMAPSPEPTLAGVSPVSFTIAANRTKGRIALGSSLGAIQPDTDYVAGVLYKSDRAGWGSNLDKGFAVLQYADAVPVRAHESHLFELPFWNWELIRFRSEESASRARVSLWTRGYALSQSGTCYFASAFITPKDKLQVLNSVTSAEPSILSVSSPKLDSPTPPLPRSPIQYLGDDRKTKGDWLGRYGNECFILCAMESPRDVVGGRLLPKRRWKDGRTGFAATSPVWTDWKGEFCYEVETGDPKESVRHWIPINELVTDDPRALRNPLEGRRRYASWDDHGETHPFDGKGPDLIATLEIPEGLHRLTLYFIDWDTWNTDRPRAQRVLIRDEKDELVSSSLISAFGDGVYKVYGVAGPTKLKVRIQKDCGVAASLSGIFLDEMLLPGVDANPPANPLRLDAKDLEATAKSPELKQPLALYKAVQTLSQTSAAEFLSSQGAMRQIAAFTESAATSSKPGLARVAAWLQWQCANSLLVDPEGKEKAFSEYLASSPAKDPGAASERVKELLRSGEIGLAEKAVTPWLELTLAKPGAKADDARGALRDAILSFCKRDPDFAGSLVTQTVSLREKDSLFSLASELMDIAQQDAQGPLHSKCVYRVAATTYRAIEKALGAEDLGDDGMFLLAKCVSEGPGYFLSSAKAAVVAYEDYTRRWPGGLHFTDAHLQIVRLARILSTPEEPRAGDFVTMGMSASKSLLDGISPSSGYGPAISSAFLIGELLKREGDVAEARRWYGEVVKHAPASPLGQLAQERMK